MPLRACISYTQSQLLKLTGTLQVRTRYPLFPQDSHTPSESIRQAASTMVYDMMTEYKGNLSIDGVPPGEFPPPYYWWQSGAAWGSMINYWHFTGDGSYNEIVKQGILYQVGQYNNFIPRAHKQYIGNDDQGFWAITAMQAAEYNFPNPAADQPSWLALVQAVFNEQIRRWDTGTCGGGLRWQMFEKPGYGYKNSVSNGLLFQIAARLARYTGDQVSNASHLLLALRIVVEGKLLVTD